MTLVRLLTASLICIHCAAAAESGPASEPLAQTPEPSAQTREPVAAEQPITGNTKSELLATDEPQWPEWTQNRYWKIANQAVGLFDTIERFNDQAEIAVRLDPHLWFKPIIYPPPPIGSDSNGSREKMFQLLKRCAVDHLVIVYEDAVLLAPQEHQPNWYAQDPGVVGYFFKGPRKVMSKFFQDSEQ